MIRRLFPKTRPAVRACSGLLQAIVLAAVFALACGSVPARTETERFSDIPGWLGTRYGYVANSESLRALLYDFGTSIDIPVVVSANIDVIVHDNVPVTTAEEFLAELHTRYGLAWIFDGVTLYLYDGAESVRQTVDFPFSRRDAFKASIEEVQLRGVPLNWVFLPGENQLQLSGPPRFVEWGMEVAGTLAEGAPGRGGGLTPEEDLDYVVRIFPVEYGTVEEFAANAAGGSRRVVNLAEMVAKLMNVSHVADVIGIAAGDRASRVPSKLRGTGVLPDDANTERRQLPAPSRVTGARGEGQEAFVIADPRLNAVIVRDKSYRMPIYERLIRELDSPLDQIELDVSVLDIDTSAAEELRFDLESDSLRINPIPSSGGNTLYFAQNQWDIDGLALRVRALRNAGKSRILTRPSVTTLDNHEASFHNNRTFYVRLGGNDAESVDLAPVSYGWVIRIRPHIIYEGEHRKVHLAIHIEDGAREAADLSVTGVPEISQNLIQTQAVVREGNSLLIGGYTVRQQSRFEQRIPLLGRIPLMGRLFSTKTDLDKSLARYFLIVPRVLPSEISYEINSGFEDGPLQEIDAVKAIGSNRRARSQSDTGSP